MALNDPENTKNPEQRSYFGSLPLLVFLERGGKIVFANAEARQMLGLVLGDWLPRSIEDVLWGFTAGAEPRGRQTAPESASRYFRATVPSRHGQQYPVIGSYTIVQGSPREAIIVAQPAAEEQAESAKESDSTRTAAQVGDDVLESLPDALAIERGDQVLYTNPAFMRMFGYTLEETRGRSLRQLIVPETRLSEHATLKKAVDEQGGVIVETVRANKANELMDVGLQISPLVVDGERAGYVYSFRDIGDRIETEARLQHDAMHDVLTGLPNRALFQDRLTLALSRRARRPDQSCGVLYLDLDRFKEVNDGLGHAAGDVLLQSVADRLRSALRPQDSAARLGGDEFAVLVEGIASASDLDIVANRVLKEMDRPFEVFGHLVRTGASIGAAMAGQDHSSAELLIRDADYAMYRAKQSGGCRIEMYDRHLEVAVNSQQERERELRNILENRLFEIWYQPIFRLTDGKLEGFEASLSWRRADGTVESSRDLLDLAEESGYSMTLAREMLDGVALQLRRWSKFVPHADFYIGVNLTSRQFYHEELISHLNRAIGTNGVEPMRLVLEVPEIVLNEDPDAAVSILQRIVDCGVRVAMDDFGSGLAPMNHLVRLPIDFVKLDGKLAATAEAPGRQQALLDTLIRLSRIVGMQVIGQGIETAEQLDILLQMGCLAGQGPMLSGPVDAARALRIAEARSGSTLSGQ